MNFMPYFSMLNFNAFNTLFTGVLPFQMSAFGYYSMPLFSFPRYSFLPANNNIWAGYSFDKPSLTRPVSVEPEIKVEKPKKYDFGTLSSSVSTSYPPVTPVVTQRSDVGKVSYKAVSNDVKQKLGPEFLAKVKRIAANINCDYKDLLAVMNAESGLNSSIQNTAGYHAYGLIQFQPATARELGTTVEKLVKMSPLEQLDYVEKFYLNARKTRGWGNKKFTGADLYALTLAPAHAKREVLYVKGTKNYAANKNIDLKYGDANGKIEKSDLQAYMNANRVNENIFVA
ncbi:MAG: transglycosylase SLT domain-containing protein [Fusobacterium sp.]|nr:transglycosylase SLT domain-containing protein [Fusobacterium sp.]